MATTFNVTTLQDGPPGSLRYIINNQAGFGDVVKIALLGVIQLSNGPIVINKRLTVQGPGPASLTLTASNRSRLFEVSSDVQIRDLTLADGLYAPVSDGVTILSCGGGIFSRGGLVLSNCFVHDCAAMGTVGIDGRANGPKNGLPGGDAQGGAIWCEGENLFLHCTFARNLAKGGDGGRGLSSISAPGPLGDGANGGHAKGGAVYCQGGLRLLACTFSGNTAQGGRGGGGNNPMWRQWRQRRRQPRRRTLPHELLRAAELHGG